MGINLLKLFIYVLTRNEVHQRQQSGRFRDAVIKELIGISVLTRYNNKVYRIDDIEWNSTPLKEFVMKRDDKKISIVDYYKSQWGIDVKDKNQPLLVHMSKIRQSTGEVSDIRNATY